VNRDTSGLLQDFLRGNRRALARVISLVENGYPGASELLGEIYRHLQGAYRVGITGPPGSGKSTLVDVLIQKFRQKGLTIGVIAVDPTSPFTGGALLGDRVRMQSVSDDEGVFIRSMASRGSLGGLSQTALEVADVMDAFGKDVVLFETVGVGQSELDVVEAADTTVVVLVPESGDSIQAMKAGLMEIADIFVLNKSDREGADRAYLELQTILQLREPTDRGWKPPIIQTVATQGQGIDQLLESLFDHKRYLEQHDLLREKQRQRIADRLRRAINDQVLRDFWQKSRQQLFEALVEDILEGRKNWTQALQSLLQGYFPLKSKNEKS